MIRWLKSLLTHRGKALSLYRAGIARANKGDHHGAIANYSAAIRVPDIPVDVKGMALYNRSLAYAAIEEDEKADEDLSAMLEIPGLPDNVKSKAHQRRERIRRRKEHTEHP